MGNSTNPLSLHLDNSVLWKSELYSYYYHNVIRSNMKLFNMISALAKTQNISVISLKTHIFNNVFFIAINYRKNYWKTKCHFKERSKCKYIYDKWKPLCRKKSCLFFKKDWLNPKTKIKRAKKRWGLNYIKPWRLKSKLKWLNCRLWYKSFIKKHSENRKLSGYSLKRLSSLLRVAFPIISKRKIGWFLKRKALCLISKNVRSSNKSSTNLKKLIISSFFTNLNKKIKYLKDSFIHKLLLVVNNPTYIKYPWMYLYKSSITFNNSYLYHILSSHEIPTSVKFKLMLIRSTVIRLFYKVFKKVNSSLNRFRLVRILNSLKLYAINELLINLKKILKLEKCKLLVYNSIIDYYLTSVSTKGLNKIKSLSGVLNYNFLYKLLLTNSTRYKISSFRRVYISKMFKKKKLKYLKVSENQFKNHGGLYKKPKKAPKYTTPEILDEKNKDIIPKWYQYFTKNGKFRKALVKEDPLLKEFFKKKLTFLRNIRTKKRYLRKKNHRWFLSNRYLLRFMWLKKPTLIRKKDDSAEKKFYKKKNNCGTFKKLLHFNTNSYSGKDLIIVNNFNVSTNKKVLLSRLERLAITILKLRYKLYKYKMYYFLNCKTKNRSLVSTNNKVFKKNFDTAVTKRNIGFTNNGVTTPGIIKSVVKVNKFKNNNNVRYYSKFYKSLRNKKKINQKKNNFKIKKPRSKDLFDKNKSLSKSVLKKLIIREYKKWYKLSDKDFLFEAFGDTLKNKIVRHKSIIKKFLYDYNSGFNTMYYDGCSGKDNIKKLLPITVPQKIQIISYVYLEVTDTFIWLLNNSIKKFVEKYRVNEGYLKKIISRCSYVFDRYKLILNYAIRRVWDQFMLSKMDLPLLRFKNKLLNFTSLVRSKDKLFKKKSIGYDNISLLKKIISSYRYFNSFKKSYPRFKVPLNIYKFWIDIKQHTKGLSNSLLKSKHYLKGKSTNSNSLLSIIKNNLNLLKCKKKKWNLRVNLLVTYKKLIHIYAKRKVNRFIKFKLMKCKKGWKLNSQLWSRGNILNYVKKSPLNRKTVIGSNNYVITKLSSLYLNPNKLNVINKQTKNLVKNQTLLKYPPKFIKFNRRLELDRVYKDQKLELEEFNSRKYSNQFGKKFLVSKKDLLFLYKLPKYYYLNKSKYIVKPNYINKARRIIKKKQRLYNKFLPQFGNLAVSVGEISLYKKKIPRYFFLPRIKHTKYQFKGYCIKKLIKIINNERKKRSSSIEFKSWLEENLVLYRKNLPLMFNFKTPLLANRVIIKFIKLQKIKHLKQIKNLYLKWLESPVYVKYLASYARAILNCIRTLPADKQLVAYQFISKYVVHSIFKLKSKMLIQDSINNIINFILDSKNVLQPLVIKDFKTVLSSLYNDTKILPKSFLSKLLVKNEARAFLNKNMIVDSFFVSLVLENGNKEHSDSSLQHLGHIRKFINKSVKFTKPLAALKRIALENKLSKVLGKRVELSLFNVYNKWNNKLIDKPTITYKYIYSFIKRSKHWRYNKNFKEIFTSLFTGLLYCKSYMISSVLSKMMGATKRFNYLKKLLLNFEKLLRLIIESAFNSTVLCVHVSGKFKGKARRTNLIYFKRSPLNFNPRTLDKALYSYSNDYALTTTGSFGIKIWLK